MKTIFAIIVILSLPKFVLGQCVVDAGFDRNLCPSDIQNNPELEGKVISGDVVHLKWESIYSTSFKTYFASDMLSDTTVLNPIIEQHFERSVKYYLTGITSDNSTCLDSVTINFSGWQFLTIEKIIGKSPADTIQLWISAQSDWPHIGYEWSPNYMISDTTIEKPLVWNDTTTFYNLTITDSLGCRVDDQPFRVYTVSSVYEPNEKEIRIFPNPANHWLHIESPIQGFETLIYSTNGQKLIASKSTVIDISSLGEGTYIAYIITEDGPVISQIIQKINE
jgi:hypothetical protein